MLTDCLKTSCCEIQGAFLSPGHSCCLQAESESNSRVLGRRQLKRSRLPSCKATEPFGVVSLKDRSLR